MAIPPDQIWSSINELGLALAFNPSNIIWAFDRYAEAISICDERSQPYDKIRIEVSSRQITAQPRILFDGKEWTIGVGLSKMSPAEGFLYLEEDAAYLRIPLKWVQFFGPGESLIMAKHTYYIAYLTKDGNWKKDASDSFYKHAERFRQLTSMQPPPKGVRLTMDSVRPDGTPYEHIISEFSKENSITKNTYYVAYLTKDGNWKKDASDSFYRHAERFRQLTSMQPPPKGIRLTMDALQPTGVPYEHIISEFLKI
jgi:hypothetical protein